MTDDLDALKRSVDMVTLLTGYGVELKQRGQEHDCLCIFHDESKPSMQVYIKDGVQKCHCKSCGRGGTVIDVVMKMDGCDEGEAIKRLRANGFQRDDTRIKAEAPIKAATWQHATAPEPLTDFTIKDRTYVAHWTYLSETGALLGYVVRYLQPDGSKDYRPWSYGSYSTNVSAKWASKAWTHGRRPIYGLDLLAANPAGKVVISEGEKAADASRHYWASRIGIAWPGGANSIAGVDWTPLAGRDVLLIPDADVTGVGEAAMFKVASYLLPIGCKVSILDTSDKPNKWDVADALAEGMSKEALMAWAAPRVSAVTSRELEKQKLVEEKKTMQSAQVAAAEPYRGFDEDSSIYELPPLPDDFDEPQHIPLTIDVVPEQIPDAPTVQPAKTVRHTAIEKSELLPPEFSELSLAKHWSNNEGADWCYTLAWNQWCQWDGARWKVDRTNSVTSIIADEMCRATHWLEAKALSASAIRSLCAKRNIANVRDLAGSFPRHARLPEEWDSNPWLMGTPDGTLDLKTGKVRPPDRADFITRQAAVSPQPGPMPHWNKVLDRCTKGDPEMRKYYQRWAGYILTGSCQEEGFLFIHGAGNSGKSKFIDCLGGMLGKADEGGYCATAKIEMLMESKHERHTEELACLAGARMVRCSEPDEGARWNEALLKLITGRDTVSARRLYEKQFTFTPEFKLLINGNFRPAFKNTGEEIRRRMHFIEFPESIPESERIYGLPELLQAEWPAIMAWAVEGCMEWQRTGLQKPASVKAETQQYLDAEDTLGQWIADCCELGKELKYATGDAYKSYAEYVEKSGEGIVSKKRFSQRMEARGFNTKGRKGNGKAILGIDAKPAEPGAWADREF
jgi:P4 family phage/plasmid primase-like protien